MGKEMVCTVRFDGKSSAGKALLETTETVFRGDFRLKIPHASVKSAVTRDGALHLKWAQQSAIFELGEQAEKWAQKILNPKSTWDKLGIRPGLTVSSIAVPDSQFVKDLGASAETFSDAQPVKQSDLILLGMANTDQLADVRKLVPYLALAGALWIVYPKGRQEITEGQVLAAGRAAGLVDVKVVGFSPTHTALKFVRPKGSR
jgi:hypothetical protein